MKFPKHQYVRSPALLRNVRLIPCQHCGAADGTVVAAHTNWGAGKGRSIKADDNMIAALCFSCHSEIDQGKELNKHERKNIWYNAHRKTVIQMVEDGLWPADVPIPQDMT